MIRLLSALLLKEKIGNLQKKHGQSFSGITGTMAAALANNSTVAALRYAAAATGLWYPGWMHVHYTCLGSFTNPVTAGRRLALRRGSGGNPTGGTALDVVRDVAAEANESLVAGAIASTAALTMTGVTYETATIRRLSIAHAGSSGQDYDELWEFDGLALAPGELIGLGNFTGSAFDAVGTWQVNVKGWGYEVSLP